jgi:hypothetical protein
MTHHLVAWYENADRPDLAPIAAIADPSLTVAGNNVQIPNFASMLVAAYALSPNIVQAQLQSPSLRRIANFDIYPLAQAYTPATVFEMAQFFQNPIQLDVNEQMQAFISEDAVGADDLAVIAFLADGKPDLITDPMYTLHCTAAITCNAYEWTNGALVFDQALPVGTYGIVGAKGYSVNGIAFRFVFQGSTPRPGGLCVDQTYLTDMINQRYGGWGLWGTFDSVTPPTLDWLANAADVAEDLYLDLIKLG